MMTDNVLEIRELSKDYGDFVLDKVSFLSFLVGSLFLRCATVSRLYFAI